jgi:RimJ/RimL family protein N-acetyltransferase
MMSLRQRSCFVRRINLDDVEERRTVLGWLEQDRVHKWLDFGEGRTTLTEGQFTFLIKNPANRINLFCDVETGTPVGIIGLQGVRHNARIASQWGLRGNFDVGARWIALDAVLRNLEVAFEQLGLNAVQAWCVEVNRASLAVTRKAGFKDQGRMRVSHLMDGKLYDRILLDITAQEFFEQEKVRQEAVASKVGKTISAENLA